MIRILCILLLCVILVGGVSAEVVTFTVDDRYFVKGGSEWYVFINAVDGSVYYNYDINVGALVFNTLSESMFRVYESYAPNTTHTVNVNGHKIEE